MGGWEAGGQSCAIKRINRDLAWLLLTELLPAFETGAPIGKIGFYMRRWEGEGW